MLSFSYFNWIRPFFRISQTTSSNNENHSDKKLYTVVIQQLYLIGLSFSTPEEVMQVRCHELVWITIFLLTGLSDQKQHCVLKKQGVALVGVCCLKCR